MQTIFLLKNPTIFKDRGQVVKRQVDSGTTDGTVSLPREREGHYVVGNSIKILRTGREGNITEAKARTFLTKAFYRFRF
jgi:hypothetical protein